MCMLFVLWKINSWQNYLLSQILQFDPFIIMNKIKIKNMLSEPNEPDCIIISKIKMKKKLFEPNPGILLPPFLLITLIFYE